METTTDNNAYVMKVCATCQYFVQIKPAGVFKDISQCQHPDVPVEVVLAAPFSTHWGCIRHESRLPVIDIQPID